MKYKFTTIILLAIGALAFVIILIGAAQRKDFKQEEFAVKITETPQITPTETLQNPVPSDWKKFESDKLGISLSYHPEMDLKENDDGSARFLLIGPSQSLGTEIYDGIILNIDRGTFTEGTLRSYTENEAAKKKQDEIYVEVTDVEEIKINTMTGYKYSESALGEFSNIYIPAGGKEYIHFSYLLEDPKLEGFENTMDTILGSIRLK